MAKKDITTDFDAESFLENYREEAAPTYGKSKPAHPPETPPPPDVRDKLARDPVSPDLTVEESSYLKTFVENRPVDAFNKKGRQVMVVNEFRQKILKITALFEEDCSIAQYVHNVLAKHFEDYGGVLQSLISKSKQF